MCRSLQLGTIPDNMLFIPGHSVFAESYRAQLFKKVIWPLFKMEVYICDMLLKMYVLSKLVSTAGFGLFVGFVDTNRSIECQQPYPSPTEGRRRIEEKPENEGK